MDGLIGIDRTIEGGVGRRMVDREVGNRGFVGEKVGGVITSIRRYMIPVIGIPHQEYNRAYCIGLMRLTSTITTHGSQKNEGMSYLQKVRRSKSV